MRHLRRTQSEVLQKRETIRFSQRQICLQLREPIPKEWRYGWDFSFGLHPENAVLAKKRLKHRVVSGRRPGVRDDRLRTLLHAPHFEGNKRNTQHFRPFEHLGEVAGLRTVFKKAQ